MRRRQVLQLLAAAPLAALVPWRPPAREWTFVWRGIDWGPEPSYASIRLYHLINPPLVVEVIDGELRNWRYLR